MTKDLDSLTGTAWLTAHREAVKALGLCVCGHEAEEHWNCGLISKLDVAACSRKPHCRCERFVASSGKGLPNE